MAYPEPIPALAGAGEDAAAPEGAQDQGWGESAAPHIDSPSISAALPDSKEGDSHWPAEAQHDEAADVRPAPAASRLRGLGSRIAPFNMPVKLPALPAMNLNVACAAMGALVFSLLVWRADVVRLMPQTAAFYNGIGMGVNLRGLAIKDVKISTETVNNKPVLLIEGAIIDVARKPVEIPRLRFIVRDDKGMDLYAWNAVLEQPVLNPGDKAWFRTRLATPPAEGREIAVRFFHKTDIASGGS